MKALMVVPLAALSLALPGDRADLFKNPVTIAGVARPDVHIDSVRLTNNEIFVDVGELRGSTIEFSDSVIVAVKKNSAFAARLRAIGQKVAQPEAPSISPAIGEPEAVPRRDE